MAQSSVAERQGKDLSPYSPGADSIETDLLEADARWLLAQRIVASRHFARSALLSRFLLYIVGESLLGRTENITEHEIGVRVFDRSASYRTVEDNIVRNYARQLRRRLADFFGDEGVAEPIQIDIPLGAYVPVFVDPASVAGAGGKPERGDSALPVPISIRPEAATVSASPILSAAPLREKRLTRRWVAGLLFCVYSLGLFGLAWMAAVRLHTPRAAIAEPAATAPLWASLFNSNLNTYMVPSDAGLNLLEDLSRRPISLAEYISGGAERIELPAMDAHSEEDIRGQNFTSFVDLQIITALARLPQFNPERAVLRFPRDLRLDDIRNANAIILGSVSSNPWAAMAESNANFRIVQGAGMQGATITNAHPEPGEAPTYVSHWNEPDHETYALISCFPNLSGNGHLLAVQGLDVAGTQAAAEALLHPNAIAPILRQATRGDGSLRPFEILLRTTSIQSTATRTTVVGSRVD